MLAKSNMAEWAFTPERDAQLDPAGLHQKSLRARSRHGRIERRHGRGVAASFGAVGLGSDTGNSIRGPSSHQALVGIRSTMGLTSRAGRDAAQSARRHRRTDGAHRRRRRRRVPGVVGSDPADPVTAAARGASAAELCGVAGARRTEGRAHRRAALRLRARHAPIPEIVRGVHARGGGSEARRRDDHRSRRRRRHRRRFGGRRARGPCMGFKYDINRYFAATATSPDEDACRGRQVAAASIRPSQRRLRTGRGRARRMVRRRRRARRKRRIANRSAPRSCKAMDAQKIDAWVYPTWSNPPRLIGDLNTPGGDNSQFFSPTTGFPAITGADGLHARRIAAGGHHVLRPRVAEADADQVRVRLRAGDASPACASQHAAAPLGSARSPGS